MHSIAKRYWSNEGSSDYLSLVRSAHGQLVATIDRQATNRIDKRTPMKKLFLAVALVVAFAAPAMAGEFPNLYATNADAMSH